MAVSKEAVELMQGAGPKYPPKDHTEIGSGEHVRFTSQYDGTVSVVQITVYGEVVAMGVARRRAGDPRNKELGMALALSRAFADGATYYARCLDQALNPPGEEAQRQILRNLHRGTKHARSVAKDARRKQAREAHRELMGWDHTDYNEHFNRRAD